MTPEVLCQLRNIQWDSLDAKSAVELRAALKESLANADAWFAELAKQFGYPVPSYTLPAKPDGNGRPPEGTPQVKPPPVDPPRTRRRGRPVPELKVEFPKKKPQPIAVGGADAEGAGPKPAQLFQDSYVSKEGPRPGSTLPPDHPRRSLNRESSVTPEVDMSDFHEVEEEMRKSGNAGKLFQ